jgi:hypothetical protein
MIYRLFPLLALVVVGCGSSSDDKPAAASGGACSSSILLGNWSGTVSGSADVLSFKADCSGASSYCKSTFTFPNVTNAVGGVTINNTTTGAATGCLPVGSYSCQYGINGTELTFSCAGGTLTYQKVP